MMQIAQFLAPASVLVGLRARVKADALREVGDLLASAAGLDAAEVHHILLEREALATTGIGSGVALPHGRTVRISRLVVVLAISREGVDFEAQDGQLAHIFVGLLAPQSTGDYLKALARISRIMRDDGVRERLIAARDAGAAYDILVAEDARP